MEFTEILPQLTPDVQVETDWAGGLETLPSGKKRLLLMGQSLSTGSEVVPTTVVTSNIRRVTSVAKAIAYWGKGSTLAMMCEAALKEAPTATIYGTPYKWGTAAVAATGLVVVTGTASGSGELKVRIAGQLLRVGIATTDTPTIIGAALAGAINALPNGPTTAVNTTGSVALTARNVGTSGNLVKVRAEITPGITSTVAVTPMASGATDGDVSVQLAVVEPERWHLIAIDASDATALGLLKTHIEAQSKPALKKWGFVIGAHVGTAATCQTLANTLDSYRVQIVWHQGSDQPPYILAAVFAAARAKYDCKPSLDDEELLGITPAYDTAVWPAPGDIEEALEEGIVVLEPRRESGKVTVVRSVVTRQTLPLAYRDHMIAEKSDYTDETLLARFAYYKGKTLKTASPAGNPSTVTPAKAVAIMNGALFDLDNLDILQGVKTAIAAGYNVAEANATDPDRIDLGCQFYPSRTAHFIAIKKTYVTG